MTIRNQLPRANDFALENIVSVQIDGTSFIIGNAIEAKACLLEQFPDRTAPSYRRALATCERFLSGGGTSVGTQATFIVAIMEAGFPYEVQDIDLDLLASQLDL